MEGIYDLMEVFQIILRAFFSRTYVEVPSQLQVSLDYLAGDVLKPAFDKKMVERLEDFELLAEEDKKHLLALLDAFLRDAKTKKAYA